MAIQTETYYIGTREFTRTWSDEGRYVVREGIHYEEANDPSEFSRTYVEGDLIPPEELPSDIEAKAEAYDILMGVEE